MVQTFALHERGRALAIFFGIAGSLSAIGPILGGFLTLVLLYFFLGFVVAAQIGGRMLDRVGAKRRWCWGAC